MNHVQFIEYHIKQKLIDAGFSIAVAQGGQTLALIITAAAHNPAQREKCLMAVIGLRKPGQIRTVRLLTDRLTKSKAELRQQPGQVCFNSNP